MRIDIKDLPLNLQKQALRKLAEEEQRQSGTSQRHVQRSKSNELNSDEKICGGEVKSGFALQGYGKAENSAARELHSDEGYGKGNKYRARKLTLPLPDGTDHTFDSKHEAQVYGDLWLQLQAGEISDLQIQVPFELIPKQQAPSGKKYRECKYIADFVFKDSEGNTQVWDAKGYRTKEYAIKRKLMLQVWGIEIKEV